METRLKPLDQVRADIAAGGSEPGRTAFFLVPYSLAPMFVHWRLLWRSNTVFADWALVSLRAVRSSFTGFFFVFVPSQFVCCRCGSVTVELKVLVVFSLFVFSAHSKGVFLCDCRLVCDATQKRCVHVHVTKVGYGHDAAEERTHTFTPLPEVCDTGHWDAFGSNPASAWC